MVRYRSRRRRRLEGIVPWMQRGWRWLSLGQILTRPLARSFTKRIPRSCELRTEMLRTSQGFWISFRIP